MVQVYAHKCWLVAQVRKGGSFVCKYYYFKSELGWVVV